jgi:hypothetical protein
MTEPAFTSRLRSTTLDRMLPDWTHQAACATKTLPGQPWESAFMDEVTGTLDIETFDWPERVRTVMAVCAVCPVRRECLAYAFANESHVSQDWLSGESFDDSFRSGVFGGTPGPVREAIADNPDRLAEGERWFLRHVETVVQPLPLTGT